MDKLIEIPARRGKAAFVSSGQVVTVINTHGEQVVDTWAFNRADLGQGHLVGRHVDIDAEVDPTHVHESIAQRPRHPRIELRDHGRGGINRSQRRIDRGPERAETVLVGPADVARPEPCDPPAPCFPVVRHRQYNRSW